MGRPSIETGNPMAVMDVEGFELHFEESFSDALKLSWAGSFGDTGWTLVLSCYRTKALELRWYSRIEYVFRDEPDFLTIGDARTPGGAIRSAIIMAAERARRSLTFLSAIAPRAWRDEEPEHAEAIEAAVEAFASRSATEAAS